MVRTAVVARPQGSASHRPPRSRRRFFDRTTVSNHSWAGFGALSAPGALVVVDRDRRLAARCLRIEVEHGNAVSPAGFALSRPDRVLEGVGGGAHEGTCHGAKHWPIRLREDLGLACRCSGRLTFTQDGLQEHYRWPINLFRSVMLSGQIGI